jgi:hypothetical protein
MIKKIAKWFSKNEEDKELIPTNPTNESASFSLKIENVEVGKLRLEKGTWVFVYSEEFKNKYQQEYKHIAGFPELSKVYKNESLWPFFLIRIPGLKQPAIKEIIEKEKIDIHNEAALLKRFGRQTISNPYELIAC